ncbi:hypothetical protein ASL14_18315 [Paenibacillus sp. IHB B 3084]|nr:hypothetical protein ASL14_18315 [Paenibacillus sp. IHB B 3084]
MMSHVFEQYFHNVKNTPLQDRICFSVLQTVIETAPKLLEDLHSYEHRYKHPIPFPRLPCSCNTGMTAFLVWNACSCLGVRNVMSVIASLSSKSHHCRVVISDW